MRTGGLSCLTPPAGLSLSAFAAARKATRAEGHPSDDERACGYRFPREFAGVHPYYFAKLNLNPVEISRSLRWRPCTGLLRKRSLAVTCHPSHFLSTVLLPMSKLNR